MAKGGSDYWSERLGDVNVRNSRFFDLLRKVLDADANFDIDDTVNGSIGLNDPVSPEAFKVRQELIMTGVGTFGPVVGALPCVRLDLRTAGVIGIVGPQIIIDTDTTQEVRVNRTFAAPNVGVGVVAGNTLFGDLRAGSVAEANSVGVATVQGEAFAGGAIAPRIFWGTVPANVPFILPIRFVLYGGVQSGAAVPGNSLLVQGQTAGTRLRVSFTWYERFVQQSEISRQQSP